MRFLNLLAPVLLFSIMACSGKDITSPGAPKIHGNINTKSATIYIDNSMLTSNNVAIHSEESSATISDGIKSNSAKGEVNIGELSAKQFELAFAGVFNSIQIVHQKPTSIKSDYLIIPSIVSVKLNVNTLSRSDVKVVYDLMVYNNNYKQIYHQQSEVSENGKFKTASMTSIGGIPISAKMSSVPDDRPMLFRAIENGVNKSVNSMVKSIK